MNTINYRALALMTVAGCGAMGLSAQNKNTEKPNIVLFNIDDMGYADISCFGETRWTTENLDSLARNGMMFTDFYSASPVSSPSRGGLLTGRYPARLGIGHVFFPESFTGLAPEEVTIAELLKPQGYVSGIFGKWHLGHHEQYLPLQQGFDEYFGIPYSNDMKGQVYLRGNEVEEYKFDMRYMTRRYTEESVAFIKNHKDEPFFLYIPHNMMHVPIFVSPEFEGKSGAGIYGDAVLEVDWSVGEVVKALKENGLDDNTLVIFMSDNGPWLQEGPAGGSAGHLREGKGTDYEGGVRVPCIMYWKGHIAPSVNHDVAASLDIFPTLAQLCGAKLPDVELDGHDLSKVLAGTGKRQSEDYVYMADNRKVTAVRHGDWKLSLPYHAIRGNFWRPGSSARDTVLVNLREDVGETTNLIRKCPEVKKMMLGLVEYYQSVYKNMPEPLVQGHNDETIFHQNVRKEDIEKAQKAGVKSRQDVIIDYKKAK